MYTAQVGYEPRLINPQLIGLTMSVTWTRPGILHIKLWSCQPWYWRKQCNQYTACVNWKIMFWLSTYQSRWGLEQHSLQLHHGQKLLESPQSKQKLASCWWQTFFWWKINTQNRVQSIASALCFSVSGHHFYSHNLVQYNECQVICITDVKCNCSNLFFFLLGS